MSSVRTKRALNSDTAQIGSTGEVVHAPADTKEMPSTNKPLIRNPRAQKAHKSKAAQVASAKDSQKMQEPEKRLMSSVRTKRARSSNTARTGGASDADAE